MRSSYVQRKQHTEKTSQLKNIIPSVKRGGGSIMAWGQFLSTFREIWWRFGSYLCRNIENSGSQIFKQHHIWNYHIKLKIKWLKLCYIINHILFILIICDPLCENPAKVIFFCDLLFFYKKKIILHIVKNILWKFNILIRSRQAHLDAAYTQCYKRKLLTLTQTGIYHTLITFTHLADAFIQSDLQCIQAYLYCQYMCSLGIEPTTFALLTQCSTTEPQEHIIMLYIQCS